MLVTVLERWYDHGFLLWVDLRLFNLFLLSDVSDGNPPHPFVDLDTKVPKKSPN